MKYLIYIFILTPALLFGQAKVLNRQVAPSTQPLRDSVKITLKTAAPGWGDMDGAECVFSGDTVFHFGGWFGGSSTTRQIWYSLDTGATWTLWGNADWEARHTFPLVQKGNYWYILGSDLYAADSTRNDVWRSSNLLNWTKIQNNAPWAGNRFMMAAWALGDTLYAGGGQNAISGSITFYKDLYSSVDGITWDTVCASCLPNGGNFSGTFATYKNKAWIVAGERYDDTAGHTRYKAVYSSANMRDWGRHDDLPIPLGISYPKVFVWDGRLWNYGGYDTANKKYLHYTYNGDEWTRADEYLASLLITHAASVCPCGVSGFIITAGNLWNDVFFIENK